jgi:hypothetical protein
MGRAEYSILVLADRYPDTRNDAEFVRMVNAVAYFAQTGQEFHVMPAKVVS